MVEAKLVKLITDDGITGVGDHVTIGDLYQVEPKSVRTLVWGKVDQPHLRVPRLSIYAAPSRTGHGGWMPLELLELKQAD